MHTRDWTVLDVHARALIRVCHDRIVLIAAPEVLSTIDVLNTVPRTTFGKLRTLTQSHAHDFHQMRRDHLEVVFARQSPGVGLGESEGNNIIR